MSIVNQRAFPRDVAALVLMRGAGLPPLQVQDGANRAAKDMLDALYGDAALFRRKELADEGLAAATRGWLYLWNGWLDECLACALRAGGKEEHYLVGLAARQRGDADAAGQAFERLRSHDVYARLSLDASELIGETSDAALARFRQLLDSIENWQPFAFIELYEQCRKRMLPASTERMVRAIQCREFELLLLHCVEGALGERLQPVSRPLDDVGERKARERKRRHAPADEGLRTRNAPPAVTASPATSSTAVAAPPGINVQCPKCRATLFVPATQRGKKTRCGKCSAAFLAPMDKSMTGPVATPPGSVGVRCPQCQHLAMFAPDSRGKSHTCAKCTARFLVPR